MKFAVDFTKGVLGGADSVELWTGITGYIPDSILLIPNVRLLSVACGHCTEAIILAKRMLALGIDKESVRESIWVLDKYNVFTNHAKAAYGFKNVITADFLKWKPKMKFHAIVGNPPFQEGGRGDEANKLWPHFVKKASELVEDGGYVAMISPNGWMQPTADIGKGTGKNSISIFNDIFKKNNLILANVDSAAIQDTYFKGVGSSFSYYVFQKAQYAGSTEFITPTGTIHIDVQSIDSLPKETSIESLSIMKKMVGTAFVFSDQNHGLNGQENKDKDTVHKHKVYHTNKAGGTYWYSEKKNPYAKVPKVIISLSGKYLPVFNNSNGFSNMCLALLCDTDEEAQQAQFILSSKLYQFWVAMQKFSGFNPRKQILKLPALDLTKEWTDAKIYKKFKLTKEEVAYIEQFYANAK